MCSFIFRLIHDLRPIGCSSKLGTNNPLLLNHISSKEFQRSQSTRGGTVWQEQMPEIEINFYPDSPLFISTDFLPRVSSKQLN